MAVSAIAGLVSAVAGGIASGFAIGTFLTSFAIGAGLSMVSRALAPKPNIGAQMRGITQTTREPAGSRKIIYGRMRVGGQVVFISHSGEDNKYLNMAIAFATHEIQAYDEIWFNDNKIWTASGGFEGDWGTYVTIDRKFGTAGQAASSQLVNSNSQWTTNHKLSGIAYIAFRLEWDADQFPQGVPNITAVIRGKKVYDPRDQSIAYSQNPALCLRDYMLDQSYGLGEVAANINDQSVIDAANLCDESVSLDAGGTQDRYQCNGVIDTANQIKANIEQLLSSMGGRLTYSGGEYFVDGAEYKTPTVTFTEGDIVSDIQTQTKQSRRGIYNGVKGIFVSEEKNYKVLDYPAQISSTYEAEDGDPIYLDMALPCVTNNTQAQRLAKIALLKSRQQVVMTMTTNLKGLRVKVGDTIQVTNDRLNYSSKVFEVIDYSLVITDGALGVNLSCIETASAIYDWTTSDEVDFLSGGELDLYDGRTVENVTDLTLTEIGLRGPDGGVLSSVELSWTPPVDAFVELYTTRYNKTGTLEYFYVSSREPRVFITGLDIDSNYDFSVQAENLIGVSSSGTTLLDQELNGDTTAPAVPTNTSATGGIQTITAEWTNPDDLDFKHVEVYVNSVDSIPATPTSIVDGEEYIVTGLVGVETRYFWLKAVDFSGNKSAETDSFSASSVTATTADIGSGAIDTDNIADFAITTNLINGGAITLNEINSSVADLIEGAAQAVDVLNIQVESGDVLDLETGQDVLIQNLGDVAIFVNQSNTTLNNSISTVQTTLANLEGTVVDLTSGTSDVFVQASPPVAGVSGIPDPIPTFSRWYDSDDNNEPYYWDGSAWQSLADPRIASNQSSITALQSGLNTANSNISANSSAINVLDTTTISQGNTLTSLSSDVTTLQSSLTTAEGNIGTAQTDITANATAITNLTTRVTDNEGEITSISTDITTLQSDLTAAEGNITTNSTAISGLTTRVTTAEGNITANSSDITALESTVNDATTGVAATASAVSTLTTRVTTAEGSITTNSSDITALSTTVNDASTGVVANANAISSLDTRVTTTENQVTASSSDITSLSASLSDLTTIQGEGDEVIDLEDGNNLLLNLPTDVAQATSTATTALDTRVTANEESITTQSSDITTLQSNLSTAETNITANSTAVTALTTRVTATEDSITSQSSDITTLQSTLTDAQNDITTNASAVTNLTTRVTTAEGNITSQASDITALQSDLTDAEGDITANATAVSGLTTRVTAAEGSITSQAVDITTLQSDLSSAEGDISGNASALTALTTRVTAAEGTITSQAADITTLQSDLTTAEGNISGNATAVSGLTTRVTTAEGNITSTASSLTALQSTVTDPSTGLAATAAVASGASTTASANSDEITDLKAEAFLTVTAGGNVSGFKATATSEGSSFTIQADQFALVSDDESQTTIPFAVNSVDGKVRFNADVEVDGDLISTGTISADRISIDGVTLDTLDGELIIGDGGVGNDQLGDGSVDITKISSTLQSDNYVAGTSGWKLTKDGVFEAGDGTFRGAITATSGSISGTVTIGSTDLSTIESNASNALQNGDDITDGAIGPVTISSSQLYQGAGNFANADTGFYLDSSGDFSLRDKLSFDASTTTLTIDGSITATAFALASGVTDITDANDLISNINNNAFFKYETVAADDNVDAPSDSEFEAEFGRAPRNLDVVIVVNTLSSPNVSAAYIYDATLSQFVQESNLITGDLIVDGTVFSNKIATNAVTAEKINVENLAAINGNLGTLTAGTIDASVIQVTNLSADNITTGELEADRIKIDGVTLDTDSSGRLIIADGGVGGDQIGEGEIAGRTIALLLNQNAAGTTNSGEGALVGVNLDGTVNLDTNGFVVYNGTRVTIEHDQYNNFTFLTELSNKNGYVAFDLNKTSPFQMSSSFGNLNCAFVYSQNDQFYYDDNSSTPVAFDPTSFTGTVSGNDVNSGAATTTAHIVALAQLQTAGTADNILAGGLLPEPIDLTTTQLPDDVITGRTIVTNSITANKISGDISEVFNLGAFIYPSHTVPESRFNRDVATTFTVPAPDSNLKKYASLVGRINILTTTTVNTCILQTQFQRKSKGTTSGTDIGTLVGYGTIVSNLYYLEVSGNKTNLVDTFGGLSTSQTSPSTSAKPAAVEYRSDTDRTRIIYSNTQPSPPFTSGTIYYNADRWLSTSYWLEDASGTQDFIIPALTTKDRTRTLTLNQALANSDSLEEYRMRVNTEDKSAGTVKIISIQSQIILNT